jgi:hypothetical protein
LFKRKEIWVPTWRGWLLGILIFAAIAIFLVKTTPYFLAPTQPVHARVLVIEGWLGEQSLEFAKALAKTNQYDLVLTAGGRIEKGFDEVTYGTFANLGAHRLRHMGYTATNLMAVPSIDAPKDRTYHSAESVHDFLLTTPFRTVDLLSDSVHSRRSWLLYRRALGPEFKVGIYAAPSTEFELHRWYYKSAGVRNVLSEVIAYGYARFLFRPASLESPPQLKDSPPAQAPHSSKPEPQR